MAAAKRLTRCRVTAVLGGGALVAGLALVGPTGASALPRAAKDTPVVVNTTTDDIQHADDESMPVGWNRSIYYQVGDTAFARVVVDDDEPVHHDGSLRLATPSEGDALDIRYQTDWDDQAPPVPVAALQSAQVSIKVTSGPPPSITVDGCKGVMRYLGAIPTDGQWHTIDLSGNGQPVWQLGSDSPQTLEQIMATCPNGSIAKYGFLMSTAGSEAYVDDVTVGGLTTNFWVPPLVRLTGADRSRTACAMAQHYFSNASDSTSRPELGDYANPSRVHHTAKAVVLVNGGQYADALAAGPLAALVDGPLLLNHGVNLDLGCAEMSLQDAGTIYLVGGTGVISARLEATLASAGLRVVRLGGDDRYETAVKVAQAIDSLRPAQTPQQLFLASGLDFADAVSAGAPAGRASGAVLLTKGSSPAAATTAYLASHPNATVYAVGGQAAEAADVPASNRIVGIDRYETATMVADRFFSDPASAAFASGAVFADALSAAAYGGHQKLPVILVKPHSVPDATTDYVAKHRATLRASVLLGGAGAVDAATFDGLAAALALPR